MSIGLIHELITDEELKISVEHCPTSEMKGDMFTKALKAPGFLQHQEKIGIKAVIAD